MNPLSKSSHIEIDSVLFKKNLGFIRRQLNEGVELSAVIKGNAYGHGIEQFVPLAESEGIKHFSVYGIEEALAFHDVASVESELMIMGYIARENLEWIIVNGYSFFIYDLFQLKEAIEVAKECGMSAKVHIEVETGMNRTGIEENCFVDLIDLLRRESDHLHLSGCCTHLAGSESISNYSRIEQQIIRFKKYLRQFDSAGISFDKKHIACSAALMRYPHTQFDMVRVGILLYGFWPNRETLISYMTKNLVIDDPLTSILSWKSKVMTIKHVEPGEYVGYGTSFLANRKTVVAIVPVGYAYGYARSLSNHGHLLIHGKRVTVIGTVNMNMLAVDVTEIQDIKHDDEAVVIGFQGDNRITVASFGEASSQLNYELLARLPHNIPRIVK